MAQRNKIWINIDWLTVLIVIGLMILGWINIYAAVYDDQHNSIFDISQRYGKQMIWIGAALIIAFFLLLIDSTFYVFFSWPIYAFVMFTLVLVLFLGTEINSSKSWFVIGDVALQPAEFAKFATSLALARLISSHGFKMTKFVSIIEILGVVGLPATLILLQGDTGSAIVFLVFLLVLYREGMPGAILAFAGLIIVLFLMAMLVESYVILIVLFLLSLVIHLIINMQFKIVFSVLGSAVLLILITYVINEIFNLGAAPEWIIQADLLLVMLGFLIYSLRVRLKRTLFIILIFFASVLFTFSVDYVFDNMLKPHHQERINELLGIQSNPLTTGYNVNQSKIAIGSGGLTGKGFLNGTQTKFNFVPEQSTDFIFCTVGEEWGFVGSVTVIGLFILLFIRLIILAERQRSVFSRVYGYSVACILFFHFVVNIGMTIGLMPVIGIPLPFFSYGGSSLWAFTILLFVFLRLDASRLDKLV